MKKILILLCYFFLLILPFELKGQQTDEKIMSKDLMEKLNLTLSDWFHFYNVEISDFTFHGLTDWEITDDIKSLDEVNEESFFVAKLSENDLEYKPLLREYSPDKQYYLPLYEHIVYHDEENGLYYAEFDDSQNVWLCNTKTKLGYMIQFWGVGGIAECAYWLTNSCFVVVSKDYSEGLSFCIYDLDSMQKSYFSSSKSIDFSKLFYKYVLNKRGLDFVE